MGKKEKKEKKEGKWSYPETEPPPPAWFLPLVGGQKAGLTDLSDAFWVFSCILRTS